MTPAVAPGQPAHAEDETSLPRFTVGAVAARLEVPIATLRSWNRRYGLGPPRHLPGRHRLYSETDIAVMRHMRDLIGQGANPGTAALSAMATVAQGRTDPEALLAAVFNLDTARAASDAGCESALRGRPGHLGRPHPPGVSPDRDSTGPGLGLHRS